MKQQSFTGFIDVEIGDIVEIDDKIGEIYDIRMIQLIRNHDCYFECKLENGIWAGVHEIRVVERRNIK
jgi:hypothetical protein